MVSYKALPADFQWFFTDLADCIGFCVLHKKTIFPRISMIIETSQIHAELPGIKWIVLDSCREIREIISLCKVGEEF